MSAELEVSEGNDGEDSYSGQLTQEEVVDEIDTTEGELLRANNDGDIISANGEIVGELVMQDGDPSVIVESIVNADGSVFVDEREFNNYCNNHLSHAVDGSQSPSARGNYYSVITADFYFDYTNRMLFVIYFNVSFRYRNDRAYY